MIRGVKSGKLRATALDIARGECHLTAMSKKPSPLPADDDSEAETAALAAAVAKSRADRRAVPHDEMRAWLLEIEAGNFDAPPPKPRLL